MGSRGPQPADMTMLNYWNFEFYKAFHYLRDGMELPYSRSETAKWRQTIIHVPLKLRIGRLKKMSDMAYFFARRDPLAVEGIAPSLESMITREARGLWENPENKEWAKEEKRRTIEWLKLQLPQKSKVDAADERREIWKAIWQARSPAKLQEACNRWKQLLRNRWHFPAYEYIASNAKPFLQMKRDVRFPIAEYTDDSRLKYLAQGMAGILEGRSPLTAIQLLRTMKHDSRGPLWKKTKCACWRCHLKRSPFYK